MTDKEKRDDAEIQDHLKKVYGFSEEQLLKELESAEKSVSDSDFPGAEERIFQKLMERKAEEEKKEIKEPEKKVVRFKKKNIFLAAAVASILALALGSTAIGEKNYFLRRVGDDINYHVAVDNSNNKISPSKIEEAYSQIQQELGIDVLILNYIPSEMIYDDLAIADGKALISFEYNGNKIYLVQEKKDSDVSIDMESDRKEEIEDKVYNSWLKQELIIYQNKLENGEIEYYTEIFENKAQYRFMGIMKIEEFKKIVEFLKKY